MIENQLKLCLVTHIQKKPLHQYKKFLIEAIEGGVTVVQLREKSKNLTHIYQIALELKTILDPFKIPLIINDYADIAKNINADGVHLGQSDFSPLDVRQLLGPDKIIGLSIESFEQLEWANQLTCIDYIAASTVFPSQSKLDCKKIWGLGGLRKITYKSKHPVIAIGGINQQNIRSVMKSRVCGVAVISAIHCHNDPKKAAHHLISTINTSLVSKSYV